MRVAGLDPGTSSLDIVILTDGAVTAERRIGPEELRTDPDKVVDYFRSFEPFNCIAGPSGYGLPLVSRGDVTPKLLDEMLLTRKGDHSAGVVGFRQLLHVLIESELPMVFLPGVIHLPSVPAHRKYNHIDMGTPDKLCVAAAALAQTMARDCLEPAMVSFVLIELGSAFTAIIVVRCGRVIDGAGGSSGPRGWQSCGAMDGETGYLVGALSKADIFQGGACGIAPDPDGAQARAELVDSVSISARGFCSHYGISSVVLSGRLLELEPRVEPALLQSLSGLDVEHLTSLPGSNLKQAAQGAAIVADGLAGGEHQSVVQALGLRESVGVVTDWLMPEWRERARATLGWDSQGQ